MDRDVPKFIAREVIAPFTLTLITMFLGWMAFNISEIRVDLATITQKVIDHERRITKLEEK